MNPLILTALYAVTLLGVYLVQQSLYPRRSKKKVEALDPAAERFLQEVQNGKAYRMGFATDSHLDYLMVRSLLDSCEIPFFCQFGLFSHLRQGIPIIAFNTIEVLILEEDREEVGLIVNEYLSKRKAVEREGRVWRRIRQIAEILICGWTVPSCRERGFLLMHRK